MVSPKASPEFLERIKACAKTMTKAQAARFLGVSRNVVIGLANRHHIHFPIRAGNGRPSTKLVLVSAKQSQAARISLAGLTNVKGRP